MRSVNKRNKESRAQALKTFEQLGDKRWKNTLELDSAKTDDEVRRFLDENGVRLKNFESVVKNVRTTLQTTADRYGSGRPFELRGKKHKETDQTIYNIPRFVLEALVKCKKELRKEQKLKWWHTHKSDKKQNRKIRQKISKKIVCRVGG